MSRDNGGPAFPVECEWSSEGPQTGAQTGNSKGFAMGLSVLDYFAAKAMQGAVVNVGRNQFNFDQPEAIAKTAFDIAEAMLAERNRRRP